MPADQPGCLKLGVRGAVVQLPLLSLQLTKEEILPQPSVPISPLPEPAYVCLLALPPLSLQTKLRDSCIKSSPLSHLLLTLTSLLGCLLGVFLLAEREQNEPETELFLPSSGGSHRRAAMPGKRSACSHRWAFSLALIDSRVWWVFFLFLFRGSSENRWGLFCKLGSSGVIDQKDIYLGLGNKRARGQLPKA